MNEKPSPNGKGFSFMLTELSRFFPSLANEGGRYIIGQRRYFDTYSLFDYIELNPTMKPPFNETAEARIWAAGYTGVLRQFTLCNNPNFVVWLA